MSEHRCLDALETFNLFQRISFIHTMNQRCLQHPGTVLTDSSNLQIWSDIQVSPIIVLQSDSEEK